MRKRQTFSLIGAGLLVLLGLLLIVISAIEPPVKPTTTPTTYGPPVWSPGA